MAKFRVEINHGWRCDESFSTFDEARRRAESLGLPEFAYRVKEGAGAGETQPVYGVFAYRQWQGGTFTSINSAIKYADEAELPSYAVYKVGADRMSDYVYAKKAEGEE